MTSCPLPTWILQYKGCIQDLARLEYIYLFTYTYRAMLERLSSIHLERSKTMQQTIVGTESSPNTNIPSLRDFIVLVLNIEVFQIKFS